MNICMSHSQRAGVGRAREIVTTKKAVRGRKMALAVASIAYILSTQIDAHVPGEMERFHVI